MSQKRETQFAGSMVIKKQRTCTDQVGPALKKISRCIGVVSKFEKALQLVLELLNKGLISAANADLLFEVVTCAMVDRTVISETKFRKGYCKLISAIVKIANLFTELQKQQIEVYQLWTLCKMELLTDDSFTFGKNMNKLRQLVIALPVVNSSQDEDAQTQWTQKMDSAKEQYSRRKQSAEEEVGEGEYVGAWTELECLAARREALVEWLEAAKAPYMKHAWSCSAVDLTIEAFNKNRDKFCKHQGNRITELVKFSKDQKLRRQQGPSGKEKRRDWSIFEETSKEWSRAQVSNRGMVGGQGDHKSEAWLG